jgi:hypothetical protein
MLGGGVQVGGKYLWRLGPGIFQQLGEKLLDVPHLSLNFLEDLAAGATGRKIAADYFDYPGNARKRITDFMG